MTFLVASLLALLPGFQEPAPVWTARVLVVDELGAPAEASVARVAPMAGGRWRYVALGRSEGAGLYAFEVATAHDAITVRAIDWERGAGWVLVERDADGPARIELGGPGVLQGALVDPLGEPIVGFEVVARVESLLGAYVATGVGPGPGSLAANTPRVGRFEARARTDAEGRFRLVGLAAERWFLQLDRPPSTERGVQLEPTLHAADGEPLRIVAPLHRLELSLRDESDAPVDDGQAFAVQLEPFPRLGWDLGSLFEVRADPGRFALRAGATYACGLWSPTRGLVEAQVLAGEGGRFRQQPNLHLPPPAPKGTLVLRSDGPRSAIGRVGQVLAPVSRHVLVEDRFAHELRFELPPGRYVARVGERRPAGICAEPWERYGLCEAEREVVVEGGRATQVDLSLARGARLVLAVAAPGAERVFLRRARADGSRGPLLLFEPRHAGIVVGADGLAWIPAGEPYSTRHPLAPGRHVLRVEADGFAPRVLELDVVEGPDLEVSVALSRREAEPKGEER